MTIRLSPILENSGHAAAIKDILERLLIEYETKAQEAVVGREAAALLNQLGGDVRREMQSRMQDILADDGSASNRTPDRSIVDVKSCQRPAAGDTRVRQLHRNSAPSTMSGPEITTIQEK